MEARGNCDNPYSYHSGKGGNERIRIREKSTQLHMCVPCEYALPEEVSGYNMNSRLGQEITKCHPSDLAVNVTS